MAKSSATRGRSAGRSTARRRRTRQQATSRRMTRRLERRLLGDEVTLVVKGKGHYKVQSRARFTVQLKEDFFSLANVRWVTATAKGGRNESALCAPCSASSRGMRHQHD